MHIYFDLDGTLADDEGIDLRPGIERLLQQLTDDGHRLSIWSASTEERGKEILRQHGLEAFFPITVFREEYDPDCDGYPKNIEYMDGDLLIDNDPDHVAFAKSIGKQGLLVSSYLIAVKPIWRKDCDWIYEKIYEINKNKTTPAKSRGSEIHTNRL